VHQNLHVDTTKLAAATTKESSFIHLFAANRRHCQVSLNLHENMKNLIDAGEWQSFHQTRLSRFGPGIAFSILMQLSLRQPPKRAASFAHSLRTDAFFEFQSIFRGMSCRGNGCRRVAVIGSKKTHTACDEH
jgi:hypothetical protein